MNKLYEENDIRNIADAIRTKNGTSNSYKVSEMDAAILAIPTGGGGITPTGTINIDSNGLVDVTQYAQANVNVPQGVTPSGSQTFTENGRYDVTNIAEAIINVSGGGGDLPQGIKAGEVTVTETIAEEAQAIDIGVQLSGTPKAVVYYMSSDYSGLPANATIAGYYVYNSNNPTNQSVSFTKSTGATSYSNYASIYISDNRVKISGARTSYKMYPGTYKFAIIE